MLRKLLVAIAVLAMTASAATTHRLATFNIRCFAVEDTVGRDWRFRGIKCAEAIKNYSFDIVGLQEVNGPGKGYYNPLTGRVPLADMQAWLQDDYEWVTWDNLIVGRATMEYECICYKRARYEVLETGSFYISPTPDVHSQGWDPAIQNYHRLVGWAKMKDRQSGEMLVFATTHTNNGRSLDGPYGSQLVSERVKNVAGDLPVVVVADYNMSRTLAYDQMAQKAYHASFYDAAEECPAETNYSVPKGPRNATWTYNKFTPMSDTSFTGTLEYDYHFYRGMKVLERHVVTDEFTHDGKQYTLSDHYPVYIDVELAPQKPVTLYVDANAATGGDGTITAPFSTISDAIKMAAIDDTIRVAAGTYNESVQPTRTISILGGYSGDFSRMEGTTVLDGDGLQYPPIYAPKYISLTLKDLTVRGYKSTASSRDGAIQFKGCSLHMERLVIENNSATNYGGGVAVYTADSKYCESNNVTAINCVFRNNSAVFGGGMALGFYDKCLIDGCTFDGNKTSNSGAALYVNFGTPEATRVWFTDAKGLINNNSFVNNTSERSGGAMMVNDAMPNVEFNVVNTTFAGNRIDAKSSTLTLRKKFGGAAIQATLAEIPASPTLARVRPASLNLGHVTITGNHAKCASATGFFASALNVTDGNVKILNSIIAGNSTNGTDAYADITATKLAAESYNIYTAPTTINFTPDDTSVTATSAEEGTAAIAGMLQGNIENVIYNPYVLYTDNEPTPFVPVESTMFGTVNVAKITSTQRSIEKEFNIDIDRNGSIGDVLTTDQLGRIRNTDSMPGAVEFCSDYSGTAAVEIDGNSVTVDVQPGGYIYISAPQAIGAITVTDLTGRTIAAINTADSDYTIDLTGVQRGIYIISCCNKAYKILTR